MLILAGIISVFNFVVLGQVSELVNTEGITPITVTVGTTVVPALFALLGIFVTSQHAKALFPSGKPEQKTSAGISHKPWSGLAIFYAFIAAIEVMILGMVFRQPTFIGIGLFMAIAVPIFSAPMMGEKSRLDHILEAADERAEKERSVTKSTER